MNEERIVDLENNFINWELIKTMFKEQNSNLKTLLKCTKCSKDFRSDNYIGNKPMCRDCRNTTFIIKK